MVKYYLIFLLTLYTNLLCEITDKMPTPKSVVITTLVLCTLAVFINRKGIIWFSIYTPISTYFSYYFVTDITETDFGRLVIEKNPSDFLFYVYSELILVVIFNIIGIYLFFYRQRKLNKKILDKKKAYLI